MLIYNTSYHFEETLEQNFIIWLKEVHVPAVLEEGTLKNPRICKILSHQQDGDVSYTLQWEVENSTVLHRWHIKQGDFAVNEIKKIFDDKVMFFETLMRVI